MKNSGKILVVLLASTALAGCATLQRAARALDQDPVDPPPSPSLRLAEASRANLNGLGNALAHREVPDCTGFVDSSGNPRPVDESETCSRSSDRGLAARDIDIYLDRSIFVIDAYCDAYLSSLSDLGDTSRWTRSQFNTVANYVGVLMALAGEPTESLGYLNAATGFFNASADSLETYVLISPTPGKIGPLVANAQAQKLEAVAGLSQGGPTLEWSRTSRWVQEYAAQCTPRGIRLLIDDAIDSSAPSGTPVQQADAARQYGAVLGAALSGIPGVNVATLDRSTLDNPTVLGALAWRISDQDNLTPEQRLYVAGLLGSELTQTIDSIMADPARRQTLVNVVGGPGRPAFDQLIRNARAAEAAQSSAAQALQAQARAESEARRADEAEQLAADRQAEIERLRSLIPAVPGEGSSNQ